MLILQEYYDGGERDGLCSYLSSDKWGVDHHTIKLMMHFRIYLLWLVVIPTYKIGMISPLRIHLQYETIEKLVIIIDIATFNTLSYTTKKALHLSTTCIENMMILQWTLIDVVSNSPMVQP